MTLPIRTLTTIAGLGLTGAGGYYYGSNIKKQQPVLETPIPVTTEKKQNYSLLDPKEIDDRLRSGQFSNKLNLDYIKATYTNQLPSNDPVEDNFSINTFQNGLIAGVYDGHIGPNCSRLIKKQLPIYMARELSQQTEEAGDAISQAFQDLDADIQQRFYNLFPKNVKNTHEQDIRAAIARQPDQGKTEAIISEAIHGSCACAVYIKDGVVYAANTGDSRVVIVSQDEQGNWKGRRLVEEQSPASPEWRQHMLSQHPDDESDVIVMRKRIFGLIAVGGSFGDIMYKVPVDYQMKVLPYIPYDIYKTFARYHHRIVAHYKTPPYLYSKPLVTRHALEKDDRYIILGTDGLWDELSWDDVRSTDGDQKAAEIMSTWKTKGETNPATHLLREALLYESVYKNTGNKEPVNDETLELSKRLTKKPSRSYRDDITITVIELNHEPTTDNVGPVHETEEVDTSEPRLLEKSASSWWSWAKL